MFDRADESHEYGDADESDGGGGGFLRTPWGREPVAVPESGGGGAGSINEKAPLLQPDARGPCGGLRTAATLIAALALATGLIIFSPSLPHGGGGHGDPNAQRCMDNSACNAEASPDLFSCRTHSRRFFCPFRLWPTIAFIAPELR